MNPDADLIRSLSERYRDGLRPFVASGSAALLDFPLHRNVGDSLIWLGEREALKSLGVSVTYSCTIESLDAERLRYSNYGHPILLNGGGNFGDIWPETQRFREKILITFPEWQIAQLPQSLHFSSEESAKQARVAVESHQNFTLLVRDEQSLAFASRNFPSAETRLLPDGAFCLGTRSRRADPVVDILCLARDDKEGMGAAAALEAAGLRVTDWGTHKFSIGAWAVKKRAVGAGRRINDRTAFNVGQHLMEAAFASAASQNIAAGERTLSQGRVVITDRLHGHILSLLLGIPHVILDNSYGKVRSFYEAWTKQSKLAHVAREPSEAIGIARDLVRGL